MFHNRDSIFVREYSALGTPFLKEVPTTPFKTPCTLLQLNRSLAEEIGLQADELSSPMGVEVLAGNAPWPGFNAVASVYCGHQFGVFVPQLGDGRALLIAEVRKGAQYRQLQLKGAGPTPYSRHADGRAVLRSSIREYVASEAMHALGIPTTRALSLTACSDPVFRETTETAAVVCRVSESFLRFGHVEYFAHTGQDEALNHLLTWHIEQHHPEIELGDTEESRAQGLLQWFEWVVKRTAELMAQWQSVGFCHGVMNTDNMSLLGLTIDYGPYGFMDSFHIDHICNHSDEGGRYSYRNQPRLGHWNLYALAQALLTLLRPYKDTVQALLDAYADHFEAKHTALFAKKMGLPAAHGEQTRVHIEQTLKFMHTHGLDFTRFFRSLSALDPHKDATQNLALWQGSPHFCLALGDEAQVDDAREWLSGWCALQTGQSASPIDWQLAIAATNPAMVARNHLLQAAIEQAQQGEYAELNRLCAALSDPYNDQHLPPHYTAAPPSWAKDLVLSCSS
ncbi:YdiU family protein [Limnobacter sp.]|uniref:protein adenylyltransferase SelO n=1 Tax=Limnobacter sp. TaxID=2003368 RepID=UPI0035125B2D